MTPTIIHPGGRWSVIKARPALWEATQELVFIAAVCAVCTWAILAL